MKILALITARGGSKRLPRKNILPLNGIPLINWSIQTAKNLTEVQDILVSTDDPEIADVAKAEGALVPWLRPKELATDTATSLEVALHALDWYDKEKGAVDALLLLQPTSPFRRLDTLLDGIALFKKRNRAVVGVTLAENHPHLCFQIEDSKLKPFIKNQDLNIRSQDLPTAYQVNGAFYLISPEELKKAKTFIPENASPLIMNDPRESIDIDTEFDWKIAEVLLNDHE